MIIKELTLFTSNIDKQKHFYQRVLGFELIQDAPKLVSFKTGRSILKFQYQSTVKPAHFAFNIPSNKTKEALSWLQDRVTILSDENALISRFEAWNANAIYFYDADKNIVEFISRENLNNNQLSQFSIDSVLSVSEIAVATTDISDIFNTINTMKAIPIFDGNLDRFCAIGNDEGLFIIINKNLKKWHPTQEVIQTSDFIIRGDYNFKFVDGNIKEIL